MAVANSFVDWHDYWNGDYATSGTTMTQSTRDFLNAQQGIRQINAEEYDAAMQKYTPVGQQDVNSHVAVPLLIAFIVGMVMSMMVTAVMIKWSKFDPFISLLVFGSVFLFMFLKRIGIADRLTWATEALLGVDIDNDGEVGTPYSPRSVSLTNRNGTRDVPLKPQYGGLVYEDWQHVAIAILNKKGKASRRGIYKKSEGRLSHSQATAAANQLAKGYAVNNNLNGAGWDWLFPHLPDGYQCMIERPLDPPSQ